MCSPTLHWVSFVFLHNSQDLASLHKPIYPSSLRSIALPTVTEKRNFSCLALELLPDRQAAETPTALYSWDKQRRKSVLTGRISPPTFLEPPTAFQQPSDCLTLSFPQRPHGQQQSAARWRRTLELSSTVTRKHFSLNTNKLHFAPSSSSTGLDSGFLYFSI